MILLCESDKLGLTEHVNVISLFNPPDQSAVVCRIDNPTFLSWSIKSLNAVLFSKGPVICFSIGFFSILLIIIARLRRKLTFYFCHEPGNLNYFRIRHGLFKSIAIFTLNYILTVVCNKPIVGNPRVQSIYGRKVLFCPLPATINETNRSLNKNVKYTIGILGTVSMERGLREIDVLSKKYSIAALMNKSLPIIYRDKVHVVKESNFTLSEKNCFLGSVGFILNLRCEPYNQSGVTVDCLIRGVPVLTSNLDCYVSKFFSDLLPQVDLSKNFNCELLEVSNALVNLNVKKRDVIRERAIRIFNLYPRKLVHNISNFSRRNNFK